MRHRRFIYRIMKKIRAECKTKTNKKDHAFPEKKFFQQLPEKKQSKQEIKYRADSKAIKIRLRIAICFIPRYFCRKMPGCKKRKLQKRFAAEIFIYGFPL